MKKTLLIIALFVYAFQNNAQTVTDIDGDVYHTVNIGTQIWLKEDLKTTRYRNGDTIGTTTPATLDISGESTPKYQWAYEGNESYVTIYGRLYTWYVVADSRGVCPTGWHVPSLPEWDEMTVFLGGAILAQNKLKETGYAHWDTLNDDATNESGFTAIPGGNRRTSGGFFGLGEFTHWWTTSEQTTDAAWRFALSCGEPIDNYRGTASKKYAWLVRCLKDENTSSSKKLKSPNEINIYPNAASDRLYITSDKQFNTRISIYNLQGKLLAIDQINSDYIDISNFTKGIYLVKIDNVKYNIIYKFIKL